MDAENWTRWSVRFAMLCYVLAVASMRLDAYQASGNSAAQTTVIHKRSRWLWTLAGILLCLHVTLAFEAFHHWSHLEAYRETARKTNGVVGLNWGGGVYFNYALLMMWMIDVGWWWLRPAGYQTRSRWITGTWQLFVAFMTFNATIIFETGFARWEGCLLILGLMILEIWLQRRTLPTH